MTLTAEQLERATKEVAERLAKRRALQEIKPVRIVDADRPALIAALWLLGASQSQLGRLFEVRRETIAAYIGRKLTNEMRSRARNVGEWKPRITLEQLSAYYETFHSNRDALGGLDAVRMAAELQRLAEAPDQIEAESDEPYA